MTTLLEAYRMRHLAEFTKFSVRATNYAQGGPAIISLKEVALMRDLASLTKKLPELKKAMDEKTFATLRQAVEISNLAMKRVSNNVKSVTSGMFVSFVDILNSKLSPMKVGEVIKKDPQVEILPQSKPSTPTPTLGSR